jgi:hypothetical protein
MLPLSESSVRYIPTRFLGGRNLDPGRVAILPDPAFSPECLRDCSISVIRTPHNSLQVAVVPFSISHPVAKDFFLHVKLRRVTVGVRQQKTKCTADI